MTIHYHGLPLTPDVMLLDLAGRNVCISYATRRPTQVRMAVELMQSIMLDNGAFSFHTQGLATDWAGFYEWIEPMLAHPNWAVIPDVIGGGVEEQRALTAAWPFGAMGAPVWHLGASIDYLLELADAWPRICFGSSDAYWEVGSDAWRRRMDEAFNALHRRRNPPWIHGLRMMAQAGKHWPLASVDSVNVSRNFKTREEMPGRMADRIDRVNGPLAFTPECLR